MTKASYDEIADWYNESIQTNMLMHDLVLPPIFDLLGDVRGQRICDLACGQGVLSRALAERGAGVVGVDLSAKMLEFAQRYEDAEPLGIVYLQDNAHRLATLDDAAFDGVLCNMALTDIPDLRATFQSVNRILRPLGWFIFSLTHPFMRRRKRAILPFCLIRDGTREEVSWLNVRFAPDNLVTPWQKRAASNGPRPPLLLFARASDPMRITRNFGVAYCGFFWYTLYRQLSGCL